ncbi:hypothetical protein CALCODRAFT_315749 [Calocera cornea HHB12733]|uniref:Uncharacterized protein n=1 Tax=Calocera cornea HHB12733 TaxID=1353952 RepID=A0A165FA96_9BASI|nr:hypothetical protein CALCODRAFT_315749 [Calocera cornea HHB12733]
MRDLWRASTAEPPTLFLPCGTIRVERLLPSVVRSWCFGAGCPGKGVLRGVLSCPSRRAEFTGGAVGVPTALRKASGSGHCVRCAGAVVVAGCDGERHRSHFHVMRLTMGDEYL